MNPDKIDIAKSTYTKEFLRKMRNDIVGSAENKIDYIKNNYFNKYITLFKLSVLIYYLDLKDVSDTEYLKLIIAIINSFVLSIYQVNKILAHPDDIKLLLLNHASITQKTIKIISQQNTTVSQINKGFYECCFRLLKSLAIQNILSPEKIFNSGFIHRIDEYLINDICYQYILIILDSISKSSYYKHQIYNNERLIEKIIQKFFDNTNKELVKYLLAVLTALTEDNVEISKRMIEMKIIEKIPNYIRFYDNEVKVLAINLMVNVLANNVDNSNSATLSTVFSNEPMVIWSISILLNIIKEDANNITKKTRCMDVFSSIMKNSEEMQNVFFNLDGVDSVLKELRSTYTEEKLKEIEESIKSIKTNKNKKSEKEKVFILEKDDDVNFLNNSNSSSNKISSAYMLSAENSLDLDEISEYRRSILDCLSSAASLKEDSRRRIIESKELSLILRLLDEASSKILLSTARAILSLSRAHLSFKKYLHEYDITSWLLKLVNHPSIEVQIAFTNSLCNFLLDYSSNTSDILECITKLLRILTNTKHNKIRFNCIFSIKNILYYISSNLSGNSNRDFKRQIMKKITYDFLINLLDDEDAGIIEQVLLIFRVLLYKTSEDIEEVFNNCKSKLLKKVEEKLNSTQGNTPDITLQSLYILCNISAGAEKYKAVIMDERFGFLSKVSSFVDSSNLNLKSVSVLILNNLIISDKERDREKPNDSANEVKFELFKKLNLIPKLERIASEEDDSDIKQNAIYILEKLKVYRRKEFDINKI